MASPLLLLLLPGAGPAVRGGPLRRVSLVALAALAAVALADEAQAEERSHRPEVSTRHGPLRGTVASVEGVDLPVKAFLGIPFARPPIGDLRFSPPQPAEPWHHVREATASPPMCLQDLAWMDQMSKMMNTTLPSWTTSEDCLYLNVFTPDTEAKLPVMVWIHGGGLVLGCASLYDGAALAAYENVVVVLIQYRLGLPGFLSTGSKEAPGNWGLLDQVAALKWVQENIEVFGGDPSSVTIFGESAGGFSVSAQALRMPSVLEAKRLGPDPMVILMREEPLDPQDLPKCWFTIPQLIQWVYSRAEAIISERTFETSCSDVKVFHSRGFYVF